MARSGGQPTVNHNQSHHRNHDIAGDGSHQQAQAIKRVLEALRNKT
jgi:hypothetical protein